MKKLFLILFLPVICFGQVIQWPELTPQSEWDTISTYEQITDTVLIDYMRFNDSNYYLDDFHWKWGDSIWIGDIYGDKYIIDSNYDFIPIVDTNYNMGNVNRYWDDIKEIDTLYWEMGYFYTITIIKRVRYYETISQTDSVKVSINGVEYYVRPAIMEPVYGIDTIVIIDHKKMIKFIHILENVIERVENKNYELEFKLKRLEDRFEAFLKAIEWVY